MKKIFSLILALVVTVCVMAIDYTAGAQIRITSSDSQTCDLYLVQSNDLNEGFNAGYCGEIYIADYPVALYTINSGTNYQAFGTKTISEMVLGLKTNASTSYTITVLSVLGTENLELWDAETDTYTTLSMGASYPFTATANTTVTNRFMINHTPVAPGICHRYGKLQVSGSQGETVKVLNMDGSATSIADVVISSYYQEIDLTGLAAGQYKVEWNSQTLIIDVK